MARVALSPRALRDLERLFLFLADEDREAALRQLSTLRHALALLADHPHLGHPAESGRRELVIARGKAGYVAKYRYVGREDVVLVLAVRHQREAGFAEP